MRGGREPGRAPREKKTCARIRQQGGHYLIALKANQPRLLQAVRDLREQRSAQSVWNETERTRDRCTTRRVQVYAAPATCPFEEWPDLAHLIHVERCGWRGARPYAESTFYLTSYSASAQVFAGIIRGHWTIENRLHWVKDVIQAEDACTTRAGQAPQNWALLRNWALSLFRLHGHASLTRALRSFAHDVPALFRLLE